MVQNAGNIFQCDWLTMVVQKFQLPSQGLLKNKIFLRNHKANHGLLLYIPFSAAVLVDTNLAEYSTGHMAKTARFYNLYIRMFKIAIKYFKVMYQNTISYYSCERYLTCVVMSRCIQHFISVRKKGEPMFANLSINIWIFNLSKESSRKSAGIFRNNVRANFVQLYQFETLFNIPHGCTKTCIQCIIPTHYYYNANTM